MKSFRFYIALLLILFSVNSIAESGASTDDIHDKRVAQLDSMRKSAITVDCYYIPPASQYESGPIEDHSTELINSTYSERLKALNRIGSETSDCSIQRNPYDKQDTRYKYCLESNARITAKNAENHAQERAREVADQTEENTKRANSYSLWLRTRIISKTIPVWSKCPESVEVGYNKYTGIWKILE